MRMTFYFKWMHEKINHLFEIRLSIISRIFEFKSSSISIFTLGNSEIILYNDFHKCDWIIFDSQLLKNLKNDKMIFSVILAIVDHI